MAKSTSSCCELNKIKNIHYKMTNKYVSSSRYISSSDPNSSLSSDSDIYELTQTDKCKYMNILDHILTDNIKNKNQCNDAIEYYPNFGNNFSLSSGNTVYPLSVVKDARRTGKQ